MTYQRFVALGDSCTEGLDDLLPDGRYRGWADRVASVLDAPGFRYANLAVRGRRLDQMLVEQVQNGKHVTVWPQELASGKALWPFPGWK